MNGIYIDYFWNQTSILVQFIVIFKHYEFNYMQNT